MPSTFTPNLGIELPANGEQANSWGITVNRNMHTLDMAINGNVQLALSSSPYQLHIDNGANSPVAANPLIIWTGPQSQQGTVQIDWQGSRQHLYIMSNQTSGGFPIAFAQGSGSQFVLQAGHDAIIYANGAGTGSSVAGALANPQFNNLLLTGNLQVNGSVGNLRLTGSLGVENPAAVPDPLTVAGIGVGGQLRLVYGGYGVIFRTDGSYFFLTTTNAGDPYGAWTSPWPLEFDLGSKHVGLAGWGSDATYSLNVPTIRTSAINVVDGTILAAGADLTRPDPYAIALNPPGVAVIYLGTNPGGQFQVSNQGGSALLTLDQAGNMNVGTLTTGGQIHVNAGGIKFPDGTVQTTASVASSGNFPGNVTVGGTLTTGGQIQVNSGGVRFPDGTVQTTASVASSGNFPGDVTIAGSLNVHGPLYAAAPTGGSLGPLSNGQITFVLVTNTELIIVARGFDGLTRQGYVALQ